MHELALTESVVQAVCERLPGERVRRVRLEIGRLAAVVPDAVRFCFEVCTRGTLLDGAELEILEVPLRLRCRRCGDESESRDQLLLCVCGSSEVQLLSGDELKIKEVEVE